MSCAFSRLILESIRTWIASTQSLRVIAEIELRWIEVDALLAWPALEEFLAIIYFERERNIHITGLTDMNSMTSDEASLLVALIVARWDISASAQCLRSFLGELSARAAAHAAARVRTALAHQPIIMPRSIFFRQS